MFKKQPTRFGGEMFFLGLEALAKEDDVDAYKRETIPHDVLKNLERDKLSELEKKLRHHTSSISTSINFKYGPYRDLSKCGLEGLFLRECREELSKVGTLLKKTEPSYLEKVKIYQEENPEFKRETPDWITKYMSGSIDRMINLYNIGPNKRTRVLKYKPKS